MNKYFILVIISLFLIACNHKAKSQLAINVEMLGVWSNDSGCTASFAKVNNNLVLTRFTDERNNILNNIILISKKVSIMTTFKPQDAAVHFSGSFLEGVIIINTHCNTPLHKVDNFS